MGATPKAGILERDNEEEDVCGEDIVVVVVGGGGGTYWKMKMKECSVSKNRME